MAHEPLSPISIIVAIAAHKKYKANKAAVLYCLSKQFHYTLKSNQMCQYSPGEFVTGF
jgi:hypothetical protein